MINKYLKTLLADNKRVIIPGLGGLNVKRSATGDVISFNSFLKFNDDLLASAIVEGEGVEKEKALQLIKDAVKEIVAFLEGDGTYEIEDVGFLIRDKKGNIRFVDEITELMLEELSGTSKKDKEDKSGVVGGVSEKEDSEAVSEESQEEVQEEEKDNDKTNEKMDQEENQEISVEQNVEVNVEKKDDDKKLLFILIPIAIIVLLAIVWVLYHFILKDKLAERFADKEEVKTEVVETQQSAESSGDVVVEPVMEPCTIDTISGVLVVADENISPKGQERYNVIIGSFVEKSNAENYNKQLIEDGNASLIFARSGGFTAVSYGGYPSLDIALKVCGELLPEVPDVWILVK